MDIVSTEATAWIRAAEVAGVELPDAVTAAAENLAKVDNELAALPALEKVPTAAGLVASGTPLDKAAIEVEALTTAATRLAETHRVARGAQDLARRALSVDMAEQRDVVIHGARPVVTALIEEARPCAEALAEFAPKFDAAAIVRRASQEQIAAWRKAEELEGKFGSILAAHRASFKATTRTGGYASPAQVPGFDAGWVDQCHRYWTRPELVSDPRLNGTLWNKHGTAHVAINPTILGVASEPVEAGFRLCTCWELKAVYESGNRARAEESRYKNPESRRRMVSI